MMVSNVEEGEAAGGGGSSTTATADTPAANPTVALRLDRGGK